MRVGHSSLSTWSPGHPEDSRDVKEWYMVVLRYVVCGSK
jgi:hypothetical protein